MSEMTFRFAGDQALLVEFENEISIPVNQKVRSLNVAREREQLDGLGELVPAYRSLLIHYDPLVIPYRKLMEKVEQLGDHLGNVELPPAIVTEVPVCYEGEYAADIQEIAQIEKKSVCGGDHPHPQPERLLHLHAGLRPRPSLRRPDGEPFLLQAAGDSPGENSRRQHCGAAGSQRHHPL